MPDESLEEPAIEVERFDPTSGRVMGVLALVLAGSVVVLGLVRPGDVSAPVIAAAAVGGVLAWASLLRPRVSASAETLYLANMLETVEIPLAAVDELVVRQALIVRVGEKRFHNPAVGRKLRKVLGVGRPHQILGPSMVDVVPDELGPTEDHERPTTVVDYADHVEARLRDLIQDARARHGIRRYSDEARALADDVRRRPAWPEIGALAVTSLAFVLTLVL